MTLQTTLSADYRCAGNDQLDTVHEGVVAQACPQGYTSLSATAQPVLLESVFTYQEAVPRRRRSRSGGDDQEHQYSSSGLKRGSSFEQFQKLYTVPYHCQYIQTIRSRILSIFFDRVQMSVAKKLRSGPFTFGKEPSYIATSSIESFHMISLARNVW